MRKRPYLRREWIEALLRDPAFQQSQSDGRIRYWAYIVPLGRWLRVVTLSDGQTVHNAFPDRDFKAPSR